MPPNLRDTMPDTWVAVDALGRRLPTSDEVGPPRADRAVGIFYFLWLGHHEEHGPRDVTRILAADPDAMTKPDSPLWGPLHAAHHWGEPLFGYYRTDDRYVLRKHAQMLTDAGVDFVVFDVTNQLTYRPYYEALLDEWADVRRQGGRTPSVAFLCPFWQPQNVVRQLYAELYAPGLHPELWFRWEGKPLILADPDLLAGRRDVERPDQPTMLEPGHTIGQSLTLDEPFRSVSANCPTWTTADSGLTLTLYRGGPGGEVVARRAFAAVNDNAWLQLVLPAPQPAGTYYLEAADPVGTIGWWSSTDDVWPGGEAYADGRPVAGDRNLAHQAVDDTLAAIHDFFCFRAPQASYFTGPTKPNMWGWLEVYPQHVFRNAAGEAEQVTVGVAQNAVGDRLGSMSEPGARGRSFTQRTGNHAGEPGAVDLGLNYSEQFERALELDPRALFVTGWNEWIAGRFAEFGGVRYPVMFVDQFDHEHSRDMEPMRGGHFDNYYYLLAASIRRYKGARPIPRAGGEQTIDLAGPWSQWDTVTPEYLDDLGDPARRDHAGYNNHTRYQNTSGRHDLALMKVARDAENVYFLAECAAPLGSPLEPGFMRLYLNLDGERETGWEGFEAVLGLTPTPAGNVSFHRWTGDGWRQDALLPRRIEGERLMLSVPRALLGLPAGPLRLDFKWVDSPQSETIEAFITDGDAAPAGRFCYAYRTE